MSGEVSFEDQDDHEETTLNWNLSHISMASGFGEFTNNQQKNKDMQTVIFILPFNDIYFIRSRKAPLISEV